MQKQIDFDTTVLLYLMWLPKSGMLSVRNGVAMVFYTVSIETIVLVTN